MAGPLEGVTVLDLTSVVLGPWATQILGDMGADVIKVEAPDGDITRGIGPARNAGMGALYLNCNRNKRGLALNLKQPAALAALLRLAAAADVFVHTMRPQAIARLGLAYDDVAAVNPTIVYCGAYGYRKAGPFGNKPAFDDMIQGAAGLAALQRRQTGRPGYMPTIVADKSMSLAMVNSVMMALFHKAQTGEGQEVETTMFETMVAYIMVEHLYGHTFEPPLGDIGYPRVLSPSRRPYATLDGFISILPYDDRQWRAFFAIIGKPEMADDARFATMPARMEHIDLLYAELAEQMGARTTAEWLVACEAVHVPANEVNELEQLLDDPHLAAVGFWKLAEHPSEGTIRMTDVPPTFSKTPGSIRRHAPRLGEHTVEVLRAGGVEEADIEAMLRTGAAIQTAA